MLQIVQEIPTSLKSSMNLTYPPYMMTSLRKLNMEVILMVVQLSLQ